MKHFNQIFKRIKRGLFNTPLPLGVWTVAALIVPNVVLTITEHLPLFSALVNILLPAGVYLLLTGLKKRSGWMTLFMLPFMFFAAFQVVLFYLYGNSVIAVDMFLNVVTTNMSEATELLANLMSAMAAVAVLYLVPLVWAGWSVAKKQQLSRRIQSGFLVSGAVACGLGILAFFGGKLTERNYSFVRSTFPVNAVSNMFEAGRRYHETADHDMLADGFSYSAHATHDADTPEIYLYVIGETSRNANWQLGGYDRPTNPRLMKEDVAYFPKSFSESNTTHKSVPMLISCASAEDFDSIAYKKSLISAFREAGFHTAFISNQQPNHSYTQHFGNEADCVCYVYDKGETAQAYDEAIFAPIDSLLRDSSNHPKQLIVVHTYGSHFKYEDRYPSEFAQFLPDETVDACPANRDILINAYDNTILYTDYILSKLIDHLRNCHVRSALLYAADHGEDIFDNGSGHFLHASPRPTEMQLHQATMLWLSDELKEENPEMAAALHDNKSKRISPQKSLFPTVMQLAGVDSPLVIDSLSLVSAHYHPAPQVYLTDLNEAIPYSSALK